MTKTADMILGALVADAAARGLHWLYDPARIAEVAAAHGSAAFVPIDPGHYADVPGVSVHAPGTEGQQTQYGEALMLALRVCADKGGFETGAYQDAYAAHFGPGGAYVGYIDRPTRGTLENLAQAITDPSGIDDDQLPALATLPAVVGAHHHQADLETPVQAAISVTNVHDDARVYGRAAARMMAALLGGADLNETLGTTKVDAVDAALSSTETDSVAYGEVTGRACHLKQGVPLAAHILSRAGSYAEAVELNIRTGGDSAGRSILLGALAGAAWGVGGAQGIPPGWLSRTHSAAEALDLLAV